MPDFKLEEPPALVASYRLFDREFAPNLKTIYYPACGADISPSSAFPKSRVIYIDTDAEAVKALKQHDLEAYCADANTFAIEGGVDAVVLQNQEVRVDKPVSNLRRGGFVLCNDYHNAASELRQKSDFLLLALIRIDPAQKLIVDRHDLDNYWKLVETDEELKAAPFSWGGVVRYDEAKSIVKVVTELDTNVVANYTRIRNQAIEDLTKKLEEMGVEEVTKDVILKAPPITINGETISLFPLPPKKGTVDDLFVYQRM